MALFRRRTAATNAGGRISDEEIDPDLAAFHRSIDLHRREPPEGDEGKLMSATQVEAVAAWMEERFAESNYRAVWERRLQLGRGVSQAGVDERLWFWLNALPALSAIRLGLKEHGLVSMCAGYADTSYKSSFDGAEQAISEIRKAFFS